MTSSHDTSTPRLAALQHRDFRLLWVGQMISVVGSQMQLAAVDWHVSGLLRGQSFTLILFNHPIHFGAEALGLGTLGLVRVVPVIIFAMLGGMVADAQDRRTVMLFTQTTLAILAGILATITLSGNEAVLAIYALTAAMSAATAFDNPAFADVRMMPINRTTANHCITNMRFILSMVDGQHGLTQWHIVLLKCRQLGRKSLLDAAHGLNLLRIRNK